MSFSKIGLTILILLGCRAFIHARQPLFRHYTVADGLANSTIYYILQDSKGYMWFCTEAGVNRFDGHRFETFTTDDGLADNENFKCLEDSRGRIWFLSYNSRLSYFRDTGFVNEKTLPALRYNFEHGKYLIDMAEDRSGDLWFSAFGGHIFQYRDRQWLRLVDSSEMANQILLPYPDEIRTIRFRPGTGWYHGLASGRRTPLLSRPRADRGINGHVSKQELKPGLWYFISNLGLERLQGDSMTTDVSCAQMHNEISCFRIIGNDLWLGSFKNGLYFVPDFLTHGFTGHYEKYLDQSTISRIVPDQEGGIWIGTMSEGVYYLPGSQSYISNIPGVSVTCISHRKGGSPLWAAGSYYGEVVVYNDTREIKRYRNPAFPSTRIKALTWLSDRELLVGMDYNPYIYDLSTGTPRPLFRNTEPVGTSDIYAGGTGILLCGRSLLYFLKGQELQRLYEKPSAFLGDKLVSVVQGDTTGCWFTSISRLHRFERSTGAITEVAGPETFNANLKDLEYAQGALWVATHGNGIFIFREGKLWRHIYSRNSPITSDICQKLVYDGKEKMWVATNKGISVYDVGSGRYLFRLTLNDVLINNDIKDIDLDADRAYVATPSGVSVIDVSRFRSDTDPPNVFIRSMKAGNRTWNYLSAPSFRYFKGIVTLSYTAITYQANQSVRYRYKMKDKDPAWNETGANQVEFYDLPPGDYTLLLSAKKYNSDWSRPCTFRFTILPLWYQSLWFKVCCVLLLALLVYLLYRYQVQSIRQRAREQTLYHQRIAELEGNALANQMNPHFIFNSLNTVQHFMLRREEKQGLSYLNDFSVLIRQILQYSRQPSIDLQDELAFLKRYMELEQIRFNNKFSFSFRVAEEVEEQDIGVPPMLIQPLLENAVKHGLTTKGGHIELSISLEKEDLLIVTVEDNGYGIDAVRTSTPERQSFSTALKVTETRLRLMHNESGAQGSLLLSDKSATGTGRSGTRAIIRIPLKNQRRTC